MTTTVDMPIMDQPAVVHDEIMHFIRHAITDHPRSAQKRIGPSEIGLECTRRLAHKLAGHDEPERVTPWKPTVGTAIHTWLEGVFADANRSLWTDTPRFLLERRVNVGEINGVTITGSCDFFDTATGIVNDWKTCGKTRLQTYKRKGPGGQYRTQAHLYGRGWQRAGHTVNHVMITFLPRDGELSDTHLWHEPYDETIAIAALDRATGITQLIDTVGIDTVLDMYPPCDDEWCPWCATRPPYGFGRREIAKTTEALFAL